MKRKILCLLVLTGMVMLSCKKDGRETGIQKIVNEWMGKTILFPNDLPCMYMGKDTICPDASISAYKILLYVDSIGCTDCKLQLGQWNALLKENKDSLQGKISFLIFIEAKSLTELKSLLKKGELTQAVFIDDGCKLNMLNKLPSDTRFQCFLLNNKNRVLGIGNPVNNPLVWELYKQVVTGMDTDRANKLLAKNTEIEIFQKEVIVNDMQVNKVNSVIFLLKNTGKMPLIINNIDASCGCTVPHWDRNLVKPSRATEIRLDIKPDKSGYFSKTIDVFCNIVDSPIRLTVKGKVKN